MRKAIIDLGTNTFNLLIGEIAKGELIILHTEKEPVLLGMGGINDGFISDEAIERAMKALARFQSSAKQFKVDSIIGFGTSALRDAKNGLQFTRQIKKDFGFEISIIDGEEEAKLIFKGVSLTHSFQSNSLIMDIGGGSTEFVQVNENGYQDFASLDIGVSRIYQKLGKPQNYSEEQKKTVISFFEAEKNAFFNDTKANILVGASGSFETIYEMIHKEKIHVKEASKINFNKLHETLNWLINSSLEERIRNEWIVPIRKEMIPIAALKIKWIIEHFNIKEVFVSPYSLKEGAFL